MSKKRKNPKPPFRFRFLTVIMLLAIVAAIGTGAWYIYCIAGKGAALSGKKISAGDEKQALEEERKEKEEKQAEKEESGIIDYVPAQESDNLDYVITDEDDAYKFLVDQQYELGISDAEHEYQFSYSSENEDYSVYTMQQYYDGVEVYGSELKMETDQSGHLTAISGKYEQLQGISTEADISENDANEYVEKYMKSEYQLSSDDIRINSLGKKIVVFNNADPVLGYVFEISGSASGPMLRRIVVDAASGEIVSDHSMAVDEMITLNSDSSDSPYKKPQGQEVPQVLDVWRSSDTNYELRDDDRHIEVGLADSENIALSGENTLIEWNPKEDTPNASGVDALANLQRIYDYFSDTYGRNGTRNDGTDTLLSVGVGIRQIEGDSFIDNACMYGTDFMFVGQRSDASASEYSADMDVMSHEYAHGVTNGDSSLLQGTYPGKDQDEASKNRQCSEQLAIGEALGDIFAEFIEDYQDNKRYDNSCNWIVGADRIRNLADPSQSAEGGEHLTDAKDFVEWTTNCHNGSTIISHPVYLMANGIDGDSQKQIDTETLGEIWYRAIKSMTSQTDFKEARRIVESVSVLYNRAEKSGMSDKQLECVLDAFDRTGIQHSYEYALTPKSTLQVYDQNNELYDNYHIKVCKRGGTEPVLSEDVDEKKYKLKLNPGIYDAVLTDLENEELTVTFSLIVNDNVSDDKVEDYKEKDNIYTPFGSDERQVVLTLDVSGSMDGTPIEETKKAAVKFVNTVLKEAPNTKISVVTYSGGASTVIEASSKKSALKSAINELGTGSNTNMYAGMEAAKEILENKNAKKKIMVVMSDGLPNSGTSENGDYSTAVIGLADTIKEEDITIYSLGFFHNLEGEELSSGISLMAQIASSGYHYNISDTDEVKYVFSGVAYDVSGENYILIRIECPVDVTVQYNGEKLSSAEDDRNISADFGLLSFEGEENEKKILRLREGEDYEICINGIGNGTMDYSISFPDENGDYSDERTFADIPISRDTTIVTGTDQKEKTVLNVDSDGNGSFDLKYTAGKNKEGKERKQVVIQAAPWALGALLILFILFKAILAVKRYKSNKVCANCGCAVTGKIQFCQNCGAPIYRKNLILPQKIQRKKQAGWTRNLKLIVVALCLVFCIGVTALKNSAASTVFMQIKNKQFVSAQMLYENSVEDSKISKKYLSVLTERYLGQVQTAYEFEKIEQKTAEDIYQAVADMSMGSASDAAEEYLQYLSKRK